MGNIQFDNGLKRFFKELDSSQDFAESVSISGDFDIDDISDIISRGRSVLLDDTTQTLSDEKGYEIACLRDIFDEMGCSYNFSSECAETMSIDINDMHDFLKYVKCKLESLK